MLQFINTILGLGASVMMPIIIFIIGLVVGMKPIKALRAGFTVGVGFIGINLITGQMGSFMSPIIEGLQEKWHMSLDTYDMGWPVSSGYVYPAKDGQDFNGGSKPAFQCRAGFYEQEISRKKDEHRNGFSGPSGR